MDEWFEIDYFYRDLYTGEIVDPIIENLMAEPIYALIAALIAGFILYAIVKKIVKLALFLVVVFGAYLGYLSITGRAIPTDGEGIKNAVMEDVEKAGKTLKKKSGEAIDAIKKEAAQEIKKEAKEMIDNEVDKKLSDPAETKPKQETQN